MTTNALRGLVACALLAVFWQESAAAQPNAAEDAIPSPPVVPSARPLLAGYDRGFVLRSPDGANSLRIMGLMQLQYASEWADGAHTSNRLFVNRARVGLLGSVFSRDLRYMLVAELAGANVRLLFLTVDYALVRDWLTVRVGQFKRPFSRSFITMASQLSMIDRPLVVGPAAFGDAVDVGLMLHNGTEGVFEYSLGVFRGGAAGAAPDHVDPLVAVRVGYNHGRLDGYSESDLVGGPLRLGVAAAGLFDFGTSGEQGSLRSGVFDLALKAHGFSASLALYAGDRRGGPGAAAQHSRSPGHSVQLGYVIAGCVEPVLRYAFLTQMNADSAQHDLALALNVYLHGHPLKLQTSLAARMQQGQTAPTWQLQSQLSVAL